MTSWGFNAAGPGFTVDTITSPDTDIAEHEAVSTAGNYNASANLINNNNTKWLMQMATFKATGGAAAANVHYYFSDHLGSASVITDSTGSTIQQESDYYPYGGEIPLTGGDTNTYKFTGKERDSETGLDYFGARYYGSNMGRWMSPDWSETPVLVPFADLTDPQTLNLYGYVRNNPLSKADADGHCDDNNQVCNIAKGGGETVGGFALVVFGAASSEVGVGIPVALGGAALIAKGGLDLGKGIDPTVNTKDAEAGLKVAAGKNGLPNPVGVIGTAVTGDIQKGAKTAETADKVTDAAKAVKDAAKDPSPGKVGDAATKVNSAAQALKPVVDTVRRYTTVPAPPKPPSPPPPPKCTSDGKCS